VIERPRVWPRTLGSRNGTPSSIKAGLFLVFSSLALLPSGDDGLITIADDDGRSVDPRTPTP
jgi:hypothetical protein